MKYLNVLYYITYYFFISNLNLIVIKKNPKILFDTTNLDILETCSYIKNRLSIRTNCEQNLSSYTVKVEC